MNLKHLNDECLLAEIKRLVVQERRLLTTLLHHLKEIERRRLFAGHSSLYEYAVNELGYPNDQAYRRIAAARLLSELPEIEEQIEAGEINLTHVGLAQALFQKEKKRGTPFTLAKKRDVFEAMAGQSTRQAQAELQKFTSEPIRVVESIKPLGNGRNAVTLEVSDELLAKIERLKGLLAHAKPSASLGDIVERSVDIALEHLSPTRQPQRRVGSLSRAAVRRQIWTRDDSACTLCSSRFAVQEDHIVPESMGGEYTLKNIRLLCRSCNQRAAIEKLGLDKMEAYLRTAES